MFLDGDVRLTEDHEQVTGPSLLQKLVAHRQVGVHAGREDSQLAVSPRFLGHVRIKGETADCQQVKASSFYRFLGGILDKLRADGAVLGTNADSRAADLAVFRVRSLGMQVNARKRIEPIERQALASYRVLNPRFLEVFQDHGHEVSGSVGRGRAPEAGRSSSVESTRCGDKLSTVNGPLTRTILLFS